VVPYPWRRCGLTVTGDRRCATGDRDHVHGLRGRPPRAAARRRADRRRPRVHAALRIGAVPGPVPRPRAGAFDVSRGEWSPCHLTRPARRATLPAV